MEFSNSYKGKSSKEEYRNLFFLDATFDIHKPLYKYMDIESAIRFLETITMSYVEPSSWYDPFEKRFYNADFSAIPNFRRPKLFASCFTKKPSNEASWVMYSYFKNGLASKSIRFELNPAVYYDMLDSYGDLTKTRIIISDVNYSLPEQTIKALHKTSCTKHSQYFSNFNVDKFIDLMLIKRKAFDYEKEVRIFIVPTPETPENIVRAFEQTDRVEMGGKKNLLFHLVNSIMISPNCTPLETEMIQTKIDDITSGKIQCKQSKLYRTFDPITVEP